MAPTLQNYGSAPASSQPASSGVKIHSFLDYQQKSLSVLDDLTKGLEQRLCHVLGQTGPNAGSGSADTPKPISSPIAERVNLHNTGLDLIITRIHSIITRLEI